MPSSAASPPIAAVLRVTARRSSSMTRSKCLATLCCLRTAPTASPIWSRAAQGSGLAPGRGLNLGERGLGRRVEQPRHDHGQAERDMAPQRPAAGQQPLEPALARHPERGRGVAAQQRDPPRAARRQLVCQHAAIAEKMQLALQLSF